MTSPGKYDNWNNLSSSLNSRSGWIIKKSHTNHYYFSRYIILLEKALLVFSKQPISDTEHDISPDEVIELDLIKSLTHLRPQNELEKTGFKIELENIQHEMRCISPDDTDAWVNDIRLMTRITVTHESNSQNKLLAKFRRKVGVIGAILDAVGTMKRHVQHNEGSNEFLSQEQRLAMQKFEKILMEDSILMGHIASAVLDAIETLPKSLRQERAKQLGQVVMIWLSGEGSLLACSSSESYSNSSDAIDDHMLMSDVHRCMLKQWFEVSLQREIRRSVNHNNTVEEEEDEDEEDTADMDMSRRSSTDMDSSRRSISADRQPLAIDIATVGGPRRDHNISSVPCEDVSYLLTFDDDDDDEFSRNTRRDLDSIIDPQSPALTPNSSLCRGDFILESDERRSSAPEQRKSTRGQLYGEGTLPPTRPPLPYDCKRIPIQDMSASATMSPSLIAPALMANNTLFRGEFVETVFLSNFVRTAALTSGLLSFWLIPTLQQVAADPDSYMEGVPLTDLSSKSREEPRRPSMSSAPDSASRSYLCDANLTSQGRDRDRTRHSSVSSITSVAGSVASPLTLRDESDGDSGYDTLNFDKMGFAVSPPPPPSHLEAFETVQNTANTSPENSNTGIAEEVEGQTGAFERRCGGCDDCSEALTMESTRKPSAPVPIPKASRLSVSGTPFETLFSAEGNSGDSLSYSKSDDAVVTNRSDVILRRRPSDPTEPTKKTSWPSMNPLKKTNTATNVLPASLKHLSPRSFFKPFSPPKVTEDATADAEPTPLSLLNYDNISTQYKIPFLGACNLLFQNMEAYKQQVPVSIRLLLETAKSLSISNFDIDVDIPDAEDNGDGPEYNLFRCCSSALLLLRLVCPAVISPLEWGVLRGYDRDRPLPLHNRRGLRAMDAASMFTSIAGGKGVGVGAVSALGTGVGPALYTEQLGQSAVSPPAFLAPIANAIERAKGPTASVAPSAERSVGAIILIAHLLMEASGMLLVGMGKIEARWGGREEELRQLMGAAEAVAELVPILKVSEFINIFTTCSRSLVDPTVETALGSAKCRKALIQVARVFQRCANLSCTSSDELDALLAVETIVPEVPSTVDQEDLVGNSFETNNVHPGVVGVSLSPEEEAVEFQAGNAKFLKSFFNEMSCSYYDPEKLESLT